jgi:hypothetical protein
LRLMKIAKAKITEDGRRRILGGKAERLLT